MLSQESYGFEFYDKYSQERNNIMDIVLINIFVVQELWTKLASIMLREPCNISLVEEHIPIIDRFPLKRKYIEELQQALKNKVEKGKSVIEACDVFEVKNENKTRIRSQLLRTEEV